MSKIIAKTDNYTYNKTWFDISVSENESHASNMSDYHKHDYFELNLVLQGNVNALTENASASGTKPKIVLSSPNTAHYIYCNTSELYKRINLFFSPKIIGTDAETVSLINSVFISGGNVIEFSSETASQLKEIIINIKNEDNAYRKKLLLFYLISKIKELSVVNDKVIPNYIIKTITYINENFNKKFTANFLASYLRVGRTTLFTCFKKYLGITLNDYLLNVKIKNAVIYLQDGKTEYETALICGFNDVSSLIRAFKRKFNLTPLKYVKTLNE